MREMAEKDLATEVAELYPSQGQWTEEDYFALPDTNRYVELSEGKLIMPPHPTNSHQVTLQHFFLRLHAFIETHGLGVVRIAPLPVRLWPGKIREPDILFLAKEHADRIGEQVYGVPDLVVEVISPSTRKTDRVEKFVEYGKAGVKEYWMLDPEQKTVDVYTLKDGAYILFGKYSPGQVAKSEVLSGFEVVVDELFLL